MAVGEDEQQGGVERGVEALRLNPKP